MPKTPRPSQPPVTRPVRDRRWWLLLPALLAVTLAVYHPAWHGGVLWDDDDHLTRADLRDAGGLARIWFDIGATQQYYPVVHTTFWLLHRLAGDNTLAYHLLNIVLHAISAWLLALVVKRLSMSTGVAVLAAFIFALHPVHVESVAWITELKNTLSGMFYFAAALAYLRFDRERRARDYLLALALFILALLSKTVTATLPAGLLVVFWWQRGRLDVRRDVRPLVPFFVLGAASGVLTAWVERTFIGAQGAEYQLSVVERFLIAGRATWFYLGTLVWPANLIFMYPRWNVSAAAWWQYLFPLGVCVLFAASWRLRHRSRAPFAALAFFGLTAAPALGFVNVYPFRYSFVADHFQYLASVGVIVFIAAGLIALARRRGLADATATSMLVAGLCVPLGWLTVQQSRQYIDAETLYRTTIARNPSSWMAYNNLGATKLHGSKEDVRAGVALIRTSLELNPNNPEARNNLGFGLLSLGQSEGAERELREALRLKPGFASAYLNLGVVLLALDRPTEAIAAINSSLQFGPDDRDARLNLGSAFLRLGRWIDAAGAYEAAVRLAPDSGKAHNGLGYAWLRMGRRDEAVTHFQTAVRLQPTDAAAHFNLGNAWLDLGRPDAAAGEFRLTLQYEPAPGAAETHNNLGIALAELGRINDAIPEFQAAVRIKPDFADAKANLQRAMQGK